MSVKRLHEANDPANPAATINVRGASTLYAGAIVQLSNGMDKETRTVVSTSGETVTLSGPNLAKAYYETHKLRVIEAEVAVSYAPNNIVTTTETYTNLRLID